MRIRSVQREPSFSTGRLVPVYLFVPYMYCSLGLGLWLFRGLMRKIISTHSYPLCNFALHTLPVILTLAHAIAAASCQTILTFWFSRCAKCPFGVAFDGIPANDKTCRQEQRKRRRRQTQRAGQTQDPGLFLGQSRQRRQLMSKVGCLPAQPPDFRGGVNGRALSFATNPSLP